MSFFADSDIYIFWVLLFSGYFFPAKDHRVLVVFSGTNPAPLLGSTRRVRASRREKRERRRQGLKTRLEMDPCRPHVKKIGGEETVIITEKISGKEVPQKEDY